MGTCCLLENRQQNNEGKGVLAVLGGVEPGTREEPTVVIFMTWKMLRENVVNLSLHVLAEPVLLLQHFKKGLHALNVKAAFCAGAALVQLRVFMRLHYYYLQFFVAFSLRE